MSESTASRTLLKSPPELWSEVSSAASLQRHLDQFGEIRITKVEPETAVAWEGEHARGTIKLKPSGWGTRVSLTAQPLRSDGDEAQPDPDPAHQAASDPVTSLALPFEAVEAEIRELTAFLERSRREARLRKRRWPRRIGQALRRWLNPEAVAHDAKSQPLGDDGPTPATEPGSQLWPKPESEPRAEAESERKAELESQRRAEPEPEPKGEADSQPRSEPEPDRADAAALRAALDSLGQAHHRPFSRA